MGWPYVELSQVMPGGEAWSLFAVLSYHIELDVITELRLYYCPIGRKPPYRIRWNLVHRAGESAGLKTSFE